MLNKSSTTGIIENVRINGDVILSKDPINLDALKIKMDKLSILDRQSRSRVPTISTTGYNTQTLTTRHPSLTHTPSASINKGQN